MPRNSLFRLYLQHLGYLLTIHLSALLLFGLFRWALLCAVPYEFTADVTTGMKLTAFVKGLWFDNVICCYVTALPLLVLWVASMLGLSTRRLLRVCSWWLGVMYSICFIIAGANIPYFQYFFQNLNSGIFQWFEFLGTTLGMLFGEKSYWLVIGAIILLLVVWWLWLLLVEQLWWRRISRGANRPDKMGVRVIFRSDSFGCALLVGAVVGGLCFLGIRGRLGYNPIKVSQAYFCQDPFLNQLGVNPVFNLLTSYLDDQRKENRRLSLMDDVEAISEVQRLLGREGVGEMPIAQVVALPSNGDEWNGETLDNQGYGIGGEELSAVRDSSGIAPHFSFGTHPNVVIILMESMSASLMNSLDRHAIAGADAPSITSFLDSLYTESWSFSNMYSAGNHTNHGMYATLYSWPAIMFRNLMKGTVIPHYDGLPTELHKLGYRNYFFMTHESQYDNMNAFFRTNGFDEIYAQENYPADKVVNSFGVQDDFLYSFAIPKLAAQAATGQPFMSVLLSISNHPPYVIPSYFKPRSKLPEEQIVEYADWSIRQFFDAARHEPWYDNTVFVLLGDHGKLMESPESELPQSYNHIPLMIYGRGIEPRQDAQWALQEDVAPTLLGMLRHEYVQNDYGMDLQRQHRDCVFYTGDKFVAARDSSHLYLYNPNEQLELCYRVIGTNKVEATTFDEDDRFSYLKRYVFSMIQSAEALRSK